MAATNYDWSIYFEQRNQNSRFHIGSCKVEASRGNHYLASNNRQNEQIQRIHISNNAYYGHNPIKCYDSIQEESNEESRFMDCEMPQIAPERPFGRKRTCGDDVSFANIKRLKREEMPVPATLPQPMEVPPSFTRATHTNPDITRCLMAHMI